MITRMAIFHGTVKTGQETAMRAYVDAQLRPLWRQFAGAEEVRVYYGQHQDPDGPAIPLILAITYADEKAMERGLASPARYESRDLLPDFYERYFDSVRLFHYVLDQNSFCLRSD